MSASSPPREAASPQQGQQQLEEAPLHGLLPRPGSSPATALSPALPAARAQDKPAAAELRTPRRERQVGRSDQIHGVVMGGGDRSFVLREGEIDVLRNVQGGVEDMGAPCSQRPCCQRQSVPCCAL